MICDLCLEPARVVDLFQNRWIQGKNLNSTYYTLKPDACQGRMTKNDYKFE